MKKIYLCVAICLCSASAVFSQFGTKKRVTAYNVKAYITQLGKDTLWGTISIPVRAEQLDLASLSEMISFSDGVQKTKHFRPKDKITFGIIDDELTSDYMSVQTESGWIFAKKLVDGPVGLFEEKSGHANYLTSPNGFTNTTPYSYSDHSSVYYIGKSSDVLERISIDQSNSYISNRDIKKIQTMIPELVIPDSGITISDLAELLRTYYKQ